MTLALTGLLLVAAAAIVALLVERRRHATPASPPDGTNRDEATRRLSALVRNATDIVLVTDTRGEVTYATSSISKVFGVEPEHVLAGGFLGRVHPRDRDRFCEFLVEATDAERAEPPRFAGRFRATDGQWRNLEADAVDGRDDPAIGGIVVTCRDVTDRAVLEQRLVRQAFYDDLTGLANRALLLDRLDLALARTHRSSAGVGLLFLALDDFKEINDGLGYAAGDGVLVEVGRRIRSLVRETDTTARLGGDEFAVLLEDIRSGDDAVNVAEKILKGLETPIVTADTEHRIRASIGVCWGGGDAEPRTLLRNADLAMHTAKSEGKGRYTVYESRMHDRVLRQFGLRSELASALDLGELVVAYQPIVELTSARPVGAEALLRWNNGARGMISPAEFIPLAERSGLIVPIGKWVLEQACERAARFSSDAYVSVNVSSVQLHHEGFIGHVRSALESASLDPGRLQIELTESTIMSDVEAVISLLHDLRELGVQIAVDDFGTGYSSLAYLQRFPLDILKIDREFVAQMEGDGALAAGIVRLTDMMKITAVAEGVETEEQRQALIRLGCRYAQGFLFARPSTELDDDLRVPTPVAAGAAVGAGSPPPVPLRRV